MIINLIVASKRLFMTIFQKPFPKFKFFETHIVLDVMMVEYYGRDSLEQFIKGKPIWFWYTL